MQDRHGTGTASERESSTEPVVVPLNQPSSKIRRMGRYCGDQILQHIPGVRWTAQKVKNVLIPHGPRGISRVGHRRYVGGLWDEVGKLQFDYLVQQGLRPHHYFLDVACGSLRGGVHLVPYLDPGHYLGIDKEADLIQAGRELELGPELCEAKSPCLVVSDTFEFHRFDDKADYALAQSLFTHLPMSIISDCMQKLHGAMSEGGVFFATFFLSKEASHNPETPHDHGHFAFTVDQMESVGRATGWNPEYVGDWGHPRRQVMMRFVRA